MIKDTLIAQIQGITQQGLPFMEGREKGDMDTLAGTIVTIADYGYMVDNDKEYVAFTIKENEDEFFFGGQVLTDSCKKLDDMLTDKELAEVLETCGIPTKFEKVKSKNKREYTKVTFFPKAE